MAQELPRVRNFPPSEYGAQSQNWSIAQQAGDGCLYFGNNAGLLEFDGARWQIYTLPEKQTVRAVVCGADGNVYCGGFAAFGYWKKDQTGQLRYTSLSNNVQAENLDKEEIWHILARPDFVLFQSFSTIYKFDGQKITVLKPPGAIMFVQDVEGRLLFQVIGRGLFELLPDNTFRMLEGTAVLADKIVQFIIPAGAGSFWAGTTNDGIWTYTRGRMQPWQDPLNVEFRRYQLNKAVPLKDGSRAIGTILNGVYQVDANGKLLTHLNRESGLQNNTVLALCEDRDHNLWMGLDRGNDFVELNSPLTFFIDQTGKIGAVYTAVMFQNRLFVGSNQGVFVKNKDAPGAAFQLVEGTQGQVWELQVFDNQLLCGHNDGTLLLQGNAAQKISRVTGGWCTQTIPGHSDALVQSTYTGLVIFRKAPDGRWIFSHQVAGFGESLRKIAFDSLGYLWGAHPYRGLYRLRLSGDLQQILEQKLFSAGDGLPSAFKIDLAKIDNHLIINLDHTPRQLVFRDGQAHFDTLQEPLNNAKLLSGMPGDYFSLYRNGLRFFSDRRVSSFALSLVPGYENIIALGPDTYLFCQENGYAILNKSTQQHNLRPAPAMPMIGRIELAGNHHDLLPLHTKASIPFSQNSLKFYFSAPVFGQAAKFSWRLDGFTKNWSDWQTAADKEFTNLPPGEYVFRVKADVDSAEATYSFRILPPWYRSGWAFAFYGLLCIGLLFLTEHFNRRRLARQRTALEAEKILDLGRQRAEAERELLNLELDNKSRELSNAALGLIRKNEILQKIKDELLASKGDTRALEKLGRLIDSHIESDHDWQIFEESFNRVHDDFFKRLMVQCPDLTPGDLRLAAYLKMNLASKEIAPLLNISLRGVENKRYRLRKKLGLPEDANLTEFMMNY